MLETKGKLTSSKPEKIKVKHASWYLPALICLVVLISVFLIYAIIKIMKELAYNKKAKEEEQAIVSGVNFSVPSPASASLAREQAKERTELMIVQRYDRIQQLLDEHLKRLEQDVVVSITDSGIPIIKADDKSFPATFLKGLATIPSNPSSVKINTPWWCWRKERSITYAIKATDATESRLWNYIESYWNPEFEAKLSLLNAKPEVLIIVEKPNICSTLNG